MRTVSCKYCTLTMYYNKVFLHERSCGAVTELCTKCNIRFPRSALTEHETTCTSKPPAFSIPADEDYSNPYYGTFNRYGGYKPYRPRPQNDGMVCEHCQKVLSTYEELQIHVFTQHVEGVDPSNVDVMPEQEKKENKTIPDLSDSDSESSVEDSTKTEDSAKTEDSSRPSEEQAPAKPLNEDITPEDEGEDHT